MAIVFQKPSSLTDAPLHYCPGCTHGIVHRLVAFTSLDVHHSADAAGIVLELRVIQAKRRGVFRKLIHCLSHPYLSKYPLGRGTIRSLLHRKQKSAPEG